MAPWIVGFSVFFGYPLVMAGVPSFTHYDLLSSPKWIGLANYKYLFTEDPQVGTAVKNSLWVILIMIPLQVLFAFGVGDDVAPPTGNRFLPHRLLLARAGATRRRDAGIRLHLQPGDGAGEHMLDKLGIEGPLWFQSPGWSKPSLTLLGLWGVGNIMIIFLASILDVPRHLYESAESTARERGSGCAG